jgi:hypothetical protein
MFKIKRLLHIHIILIYFTYIYSHGYSSSHKQAHASDETATLLNNDEMTEEQIKNLKKEYKALAMERLFDIKGKPSQDMPKNPNTKLRVPSAILKQYVKYRDEVREIVPDDRDFYGRINIDDVGSHENLWTAHIGDFDVEVDMPARDESLDSESFGRDDASHIALLPLARKYLTPIRCIQSCFLIVFGPLLTPHTHTHTQKHAQNHRFPPTDDPEEVPPRLAATLPPYEHGNNARKKYISVHLKYNLSQEIYSSPTAAADFRGAELRLTREKIRDCESNNDCTRKPLPFFTNGDQSEQSPISEDEESGSNRVPRYQMVFLLEVTGVDSFKDLQAKVFASKKIDTLQTSPLTFDISRTVKKWLKDPKSNHGIIVRITNVDDQEADSQRRPKQHRPHTSKRDINSSLTNASDIGLEAYPSEMGVLEHVRLKRAFREQSDSHEIWREKQPSIIIWSKPTRTDSARRHVKRHHSEQDMQSDEPDTTTVDYQQASTVTHTGNGEAQQQATHATHNDKQSHTTPSSGYNRRDHVPTAASSSSRRGPPPSVRTSSGGRPSSQQSGRPKGKGRPAVKQSDKCSKRSLNINFDEVGWSSWIIAPHSYYANYCSGDCNWPLSDTQNATNHAIIQSIYRTVGRLVPKSCCAPVKLGRMAILYQLDGIVQMRLYDDMIVEACGCL